MSQRKNPGMRNAILLYLLTFSLILSACNEKEAKLISEKTLSYPSGSGIEYFNNSLFIIGDDAPYLLKLDKQLNYVDTILLYGSSHIRIPKEEKADLEAMAIVKDSNMPSLLMLGSGSITPQRNAGWLVNPATRQRIPLDLSVFYKRLNNRDIPEINIEGIAKAGNNLLLVNRGNLTHRVNHLIITDKRFVQDQENARIRIIRLGGNDDTANFRGASGMDYSAKTDRLVLTVSTEETSSSFEDGEIGESYLWIINDFLSKTRMTAINPNKVIQLSKIDPKLKKQKIESVAILSDTGDEMELMLVADNDNGETSLFRIILSK